MTSNNIFAALGNLITGNSVQQAEDVATQAFEAIAGELVIIIILLAIITGRVWNR
jgi:hypothetical protein